MKIVRDPFLIIVVFVAIILITFAPLTGRADSEESIQQERTLCIEECKRTSIGRRA
jgi:hypothetical protein